MRRLISTWKDSSVDKILPNSIRCHRELLQKKESFDVANFILVSLKEVATLASPFNNHNPDQSVAISITATLPTLKNLGVAEDLDDQ